MKVRGAAVLATAILVLAACEKPDEESAEEEQKPAIPVEVATAIRADIFATYSGTAAIEAFAEATVIAKVGGELRELYVEEGDDVNAGQVLARLDGDRLRLELAQSEANLQKLRRDFQRNRDLKDRSLISAGDFEKIQYEMEALEASNKLARLELSYTEIRAPIDGVISARYVKTGNTIDVNAPVYRVTSLEPLVAYLHVPEREYRRISPGMPARLHVDALHNTEFDADVARVSPVIDPDTGTFKITVEVTDESRRLKPGMFARISIVSDMHADALQVPRAAIVEEAGSEGVFVVSDGVAEHRAVNSGFTSNGRVEILDGLSSGEQIIVVGHTGLRDGSRVQVINEAQNESSAVAKSPSSSRDDS